MHYATPVETWATLHGHPPRPEIAQESVTPGILWDAPDLALLRDIHSCPMGDPRLIESWSPCRWSVSFGERTPQASSRSQSWPFVLSRLDPARRTHAVRPHPRTRRRQVPKIPFHPRLVRRPPFWPESIKGCQCAACRPMISRSSSVMSRANVGRGACSRNTKVLTSRPRRREAPLPARQTGRARAANRRAIPRHRASAPSRDRGGPDGGG